MPIISRVGRKRWRTRIAIGVLYALLSLGALTTLYPFLLMISTGMKGPTDQYDNRLIPAYFSDEWELFRKFVDDKYSGNLEIAGSVFGDRVAGILLSATPSPSRTVIQPLSPEEARRFEEFLLSLPLDQWEAGFRIAPGRMASTLSLKYQDWLRKKYPSIQDLNAAYTEQNAVYQTVQPPAERYTSRRWTEPTDRKFREWQEFKKTLPPHFRIPITLTRQWQNFLRARSSNQIQALPPEIRGEAQEFSEIPLAEGTPLYEEFLTSYLPPRYQKDHPEKRWQALTGQSRLPLAEYDAYYVQTHARELKKQYAFRNYAFVLDYIALHGRALWNTVAFCLLAVLTQLTVNPLAAYALSRFRPPATAKILLFLLATMAFPAEVTLIPGFLLLRDLGLLNTFAALVLPTAASGYSIYLLKGFFDSLPKDYYESADLEGAKESTLFFKITLPLSKPVMAVIALTAFMGAYSAFMYAFLVAQDQKMWTLMVWIYQLQMNAPMSVMMAALTLAALPTLLVFLAAQRVILRGIILPSEK